MIVRVRNWAEGLYRAAAAMVQDALGLALFVGGAFLVWQMIANPATVASVTLLFGFAGAGTGVAGALLFLGVRRQLAVETLTALAAGSFALDLALISSKPVADVVTTTVAPIFWLACVFVLRLFEPPTVTSTVAGATSRQPLRSVQSAGLRGR